MLFQEADVMETIIDPMILLFYIIAASIFAISSYKKVDLRLFALTFFLMMGAIIFCIIGIELIEAIFVLTASSVAMLAAVVLRLKTRKFEVKING